jgi:arginyl-tRNA synthetase
MNNFKNTVAKDLFSCISQFSSDISLTVDDILSMFEYPPDSSLGDIAFPCFKLSRILRKAPPMIAKEISEKFNSSVVEKTVAVNGYLNIFVTNDWGNGGSFHRGSKPYDPNKEYKASLTLSVDELIVNDCTINNSDSSLDRE